MFCWKIKHSISKGDRESMLILTIGAVLPAFIKPLFSFCQARLHGHEILQYECSIWRLRERYAILTRVAMVQSTLEQTCMHNYSQFGPSRTNVTATAPKRLEKQILYASRWPTYTTAPYFVVKASRTSCWCKTQNVLVSYFQCVV